MNEKPKPPRIAPVDLPLHSDTAAVDVFLFAERNIAEIVFPYDLRPHGVLVLGCSIEYRDMLRGRSVRNFYDMTSDVESGAFVRQAKAMRDRIRDRMLSYGSIVDVADDWPALRRLKDPIEVAELLGLLHRAFTLSKSGTPPTAEEMRAIMEGKHVH